MEGSIEGRYRGISSITGATSGSDQRDWPLTAAGCIAGIAVCDIEDGDLISFTTILVG
jgi:hypothetical protein